MTVNFFNANIGSLFEFIVWCCFHMCYLCTFEKLIWPDKEGISFFCFAFSFSLYSAQTILSVPLIVDDFFELACTLNCSY
jgi:hypothetical protein